MAGKTVAQQMIGAGKVLLGKDHVCTPREVELCIEHIGNVDDGPEGNRRELLKAMISKGREDTSLEKVAVFLGITLDG